MRGGYSKISADLFGCSTARNKGTCSYRLNIRRDQIEAIVLEGLKTRLMDPALFKTFAEEFVAKVNRLRGTENIKAEQLSGSSMRRASASAASSRRSPKACRPGGCFPTDGRCLPCLLASRDA